MSTAWLKGLSPRHPSDWVASGFGAGLAPWAPGTAGTLLAVPLVWVMREWPLWVWLATAAAGFVLGVFVAARVVMRLKLKDPGVIVWDEVVGFVITMLWVPVTPLSLLIGFLAFRLFDIVKPPPTRQLERLPHGWGVMADDAMAGVYAGVAVVGVLWLLT